jgi:hypothetical protein
MVIPGRATAHAGNPRVPPFEISLPGIYLVAL